MVEARMEMISNSEAILRDPDFFKRRSKENYWNVDITLKDGTTFNYVGADVVLSCSYGKYETGVVARDGKPIYDAIFFTEAPSVNIIVWGFDKKTRQIKACVLSQERPGVVDPDEIDGKSVLFEQVAMGFRNKLENGEYETAEEGAIREAKEETHVKAVKSIMRPNAPFHFPGVYSKTPEDVVFVEVELDNIGELEDLDDGERIESRHFITVKQLWADIRAGRTERGLCRLAISNDAVLQFFANLGNIRKMIRERELAREGRQLQFDI